MGATVNIDVKPREVWGTFTYAPTDATPTIAVTGAVIAAQFWNTDSSGGYATEIKWSKTVSGNVTTVTYYPQSDVTNGVFVIYCTL